MKKLYVDCLSGHYRAALTENGVLTELIYQDKDEAVGDIYVGRVEKLLPSGIAFVNIGRERPVFLQCDGIKSGRDVIIQIEKEAYNEKCAAATEKLALNGKYAVVIYNDSGVGISKKITASPVREKLRQIGEKYADYKFGIIIRTNAEEAEDSETEAEIASLKSSLEDIINRGRYTKAPALLYKEPDIITKTIRDIITADCDEVIINDDVEIGCNATIYKGSSPMFNYYGIQPQIEKLFHKRIWLKSGGYIVIDETEAMTVIDVNSGKAIGEKNYMRVNEEAAAEAARQIRLRNLSGMIIIDFINVADGNPAIYDTLKKYLAADRVKTHIVGMTRLGLMQLTRQKKRKPLSKYIYCQCPVCTGIGYVKSIEYLAETIINEITDILSSTIYRHIELSSSNAVIDEVAEYIKPIENKFNAVIALNKIKTTRFDYYSITKSK